MRRPDLPPEFDGCNWRCRKKQVHCLTWGDCQQAPPPPPPPTWDESPVEALAAFIGERLTFTWVAEDGYTSLGFTSAADLAAAVLPYVLGEIEQALTLEQLESYGPSQGCGSSGHCGFCGEGHGECRC